MQGRSKCAIIVTDGREKELLPSRFDPDGSSTLLQYVLDSVWTVVDDLIVIFSNEPDLSLIETIAPFGVKIAVEKNTTQLSMLLAGFKASRSENCLAVTSSLPFIKPNVILYLFDSVHGSDAAVPRWKNGRTEPMLAVYSKKAFIHASANAKSIDSVLENLYAVRYIEIERELRPLDPELHSFFRVRNKLDLDRAKMIALADKAQ